MLHVGPNFFETLHIPFLAGREFTASDFDLASCEWRRDADDRRRRR